MENGKSSNRNAVALVPGEASCLNPSPPFTFYLVFSTKNQQPFLRDGNIRASLHAELGGISKRLDCPPIITGGVEDHVHLLVRFGRTITQAEWVKELKRVSNLWLKEKYAYTISSGKAAMPIFQSANQICSKLGNTSQIKKNITAKLVFKMR